ncbi:MAG TPA: DUF2085 domain-containing protein [Blastocatellia bacterium]|nr:DUF2085 domain-containing protein [Blastocatellia bacterium]
MKQNPQTGARLVYAAAVAGVLVWLALIIAAPLLIRRHPVPALLIYQSFSAVCHQLPERSFHLLGCPFAVCSRCTGIYSGFLLGLIAYPFARRLDDETMPERRWLLVAVAPMLIDFAGNAIGIFTNTFSSRTITGLVGGVASAFYIFPGLVAIYFQAAGLRTAVNATPGIPTLNPGETSDARS